MKTWDFPASFVWRPSPSPTILIPAHAVPCTLVAGHGKSAERAHAWAFLRFINLHHGLTAI